LFILIIIYLYCVYFNLLALLFLFASLFILIIIYLYCVYFNLLTLLFLFASFLF